MISDIVSRLARNNVQFQKPRTMHILPILSQSMNYDQRRKVAEAELRKLMNIIYHDEKYFVMEPFADKLLKNTTEVFIDRKIWLVIKFLPNSQTEVKIGDLIRFGRVTFKVTELVLTKEEIDSTQKNIEQLNQGMFEVLGKTPAQQQGPDDIIIGRSPS